MSWSVKFPALFISQPILRQMDANAVLHHREQHGERGSSSTALVGLGALLSKARAFGPFNKMTVI